MTERLPGTCRDCLAGKTACPIGSIHARYCTDDDRTWVKATAKRLRRRTP